MDEINQNSSQEAIINFCAYPPSELCLTDPQYSNRVVKLPGRGLVKYGRGVRPNEAPNQRCAREIIDLAIVYVPEVYRNFTDANGIEYIIMEHIEGKPVTRLDSDPLKDRVTKILAHFASIHSSKPGPLGHGSSPALIFGEQEEPEFHSIMDVEQWINARLLKHQTPISLQGLQLSLCHLDIAPRNMLERNDGSICLLDWASAGYYPWFFEASAQRLVEGQDNSFHTQLLDCMRQPSEEENCQIDAILIAHFNCQKYYLFVISSKMPHYLARLEANSLGQDYPTVHRY
ncbi:hypothetical protein FH972_024055 [Carpinus fangiana]|uniref:Aminoglycoside phosphotransferase domain-containing protein n=1 Tax=Carpinus fangiana TaxID=176857 RepID=A0A5N6KXQ7_9ROSI|nr:hypothetical protein FH972_024055 [Carpinus fangiana]